MKPTRIKSANRVLELFEHFAAVQCPQSVGDIATAMQIPQSSTSVLLNSLLQIGYLEKDGATRRYYPTLRILLISTWMRRRHTQAGLLPRLLSEAADATGESAILSMRNGIFSQYLFAQEGGDPLRLHVESGLMRPLACSSTGWVLMSRLADREIGKIIRRTQAETANDHWRTTAIKALENVKQTRERGYAFSNGETTAGAGGIAIRVPRQDRGTELAISLGGPIERLMRKKNLILEVLREASQRIQAHANEAFLEATGSGPAPKNP